MAYRLTTTLGAAALAFGCLSVAPAFAQETATPSSPESADKDTSAKMHPMHHAAMHPKMMHGKMHGKMAMHGKMSGESMAEGKSMQGVRSQDMGTDALNNQSLQAAKSNTAFTPSMDSAKAMPGGMHGKMMHGKMMSGSMSGSSMGTNSTGGGSMDPGSMGGTAPAQTSGVTGGMGGGNEGNGAMAGSSTGGVGGAAGTPMPKP